jgi:hypothetical protein
MAAVGVAGSTFTVEVGAAHYEDQVTTGTVTTTPTITRTKTLGDVNFTQTDLNSTISLNFLYDENTGMYDALATAAAAGTSIAIEIATGAAGADGQWLGSAMYIDSLDMTTDAANIAMCTVSLQGNVTFS